jgi:selenide,water dikinase
MTTDFFTPVVDDPYSYGAIAAANSLSDIYAMGAKPFMALNIAALPTQLPVEILSEIVRGGAEKAKEAGVVVVGGHTVQDQEPKFGLVVLGFVGIDQILTKRGALPGDRLVMTKPIGFGVITSAIKQEKAIPEDIVEVITWMEQLNDRASLLAVDLGLKAATDVTGFSLLGHAWEMANASGVGLKIEYGRIPILNSAYRYGELGTFPGGAFDNRSYFREHVRFIRQVNETEEMLLYDPQTSGGLLLSVPAADLPALRQKAAEMEQPVWVMGEVIEGDCIEVV